MTRLKNQSEFTQMAEAGGDDCCLCTREEL